MPTWGYSINKDNQIDFDLNNREIMRKIVMLEPEFQTCIACGTCTGTCSAGNFEPFSLRKIIIQISRGEVKGIEKDIERCMFCGKCSMICPRGINTRNLLLSIKKALN